TNLFQYCFSIHRLEVFLLGLVRNGSESHLPFDHRDRRVSKADLIAVIDNGCKTDSRSVDQIPRRHIGCLPDGGVGAARGVATESQSSDGGVGVAGGVESERTGSAGGVVEARGVVKERIASAGGVQVARSVFDERIDSNCGVGTARGVTKERIDSACGV